MHATANWYANVIRGPPPPPRGMRQALWHCGMGQALLHCGMRQALWHGAGTVA